MFDLSSVKPPDEELIIERPNANTDKRWMVRDGRYRGKLAVDTNNGDGYTFGKDRHGRSYGMMHFVVTIVDEGKPENNMKVFDSRSTIVLDSVGTCPLAAVLHALRIPVPARTTKTGLMELVMRHVAGEPLVGIEVQWQCRYQDGNVRGMRKFPEEVDENGSPTGEYVPEAEAPDGQIYPARAVIVRYMPVEEVR